MHQEIMSLGIRMTFVSILKFSRFLLFVVNFLKAVERNRKNISFKGKLGS